jgi:site-specific DNA recombinase
MGIKRPGYLLQGLLICSECRYAYYGRTTRQRGAGGLKDFTYYRCSGTDGYRFGGERICNNPQINGEFVEVSVWTKLCQLLKNSQLFEQQHEQEGEIARNPENLEPLKSELRKLQRGVERLIDSYSEGAIDKEQFMSRLNRTKDRIADLEARIRSNTDGTDRRQEIRNLVDHFRRFADHLGRGLDEIDWNRRREIICNVIERIEIGRSALALIFRVPYGIAIPKENPIVFTLPRSLKG